MRAPLCARRLTRPCCLADISTGSVTLQRPPFAALGACGGHPEDAPLRPAGALVSQTSAADCRVTDPRVSNCWSPMRAAPFGTTRREGRAAGPGSGHPQGPAGQPPARWSAVAARRLWALRSARCRVTWGPAARCVSTRSRLMRAPLCARRLTRPCCLADISTGSAALQRPPFAAPRRLRTVTRRRAVAPGRRVGQPDVCSGLQSY